MTSDERMDMLDFAVRLARHVGREILLPRLRAGGVKPAGFEKKGATDLVTEADKLAEREIVAAIRARSSSPFSLTCLPPCSAAASTTRRCRAWASRRPPRMSSITSKSGPAVRSSASRPRPRN